MFFIKKIINCIKIAQKSHVFHLWQKKIKMSQKQGGEFEKKKLGTSKVKKEISDLKKEYEDCLQGKNQVEKYPKRLGQVAEERSSGKRYH